VLVGRLLACTMAGQDSFGCGIGEQDRHHVKLRFQAKLSGLAEHGMDLPRRTRSMLHGYGEPLDATGHGRNNGDGAHNGPACNPSIQH
jgi:hypothetical protein